MVFGDHGGYRFVFVFFIVFRCLAMVFVGCGVAVKRGGNDICFVSRWYWAADDSREGVLLGVICSV